MERTLRRQLEAINNYLDWINDWRRTNGKAAKFPGGFELDGIKDGKLQFRRLPYQGPEEEPDDDERENELADRAAEDEEVV